MQKNRPSADFANCRSIPGDPILAVAISQSAATKQVASLPVPDIMLHAARLLEVGVDTQLQPGEFLVEADRIRADGSSVDHPQGARASMSHLNRMASSSPVASGDACPGALTIQTNTATKSRRRAEKR
jgi:hypothetical protein